MGGGILTGAFWGIVVSAVVMAGISLSTDLPPRPEAEPVAATEAGDQAAPETETEPDTAAPDEDAPEAEPSEDEASVAPSGDEPAADPAAPATAATPNGAAEEGTGAVEPVNADPAAPEQAPEETPEQTPEQPQTAAPETGAQPEEEAAADTQAPLITQAAPAESVPLPSGSEFNRPPPEEAATLPQADAAPATTPPAAPSGQTVEAQPAPAPDTAPQPSVAEAPAQPAGPAPIAPSPSFTSVASAAPAISAEAPSRISLPQVSGAPSADVTPAPLPVDTPSSPADVATRTPEPEAPVASQAPEDSTAIAALPEGPATPRLPQAGAEEALPAPRLPQVVRPETGGGTPPRPSLPQIAALPQAPEAPRLPQAGQGASDPMPPVPEATPDEATETAEAGDGAGSAPAEPNALRDHAVAFDATGGGPLMAVVLIDDPDSRLDPSTVTRFSFPVTFAIDPLRPDAAARAAELQEAGFEIVLLANAIPNGATPADTEVALAAAQDSVPNAVAVLDTPESLVQANRPVLDSVVAALQETGHGLLAFPRGLNPAEETARRSNVPAATVFRLLDDEDQRATVITRYLSRAAFAAAADGSVVVVGRTRPDTVTALFSWALGSRSNSVTLAPISAVLLQDAE